MSYPFEVRKHAIHLRSQGFSFQEIAHQLSVPRGTIRSWVYSIPLNEEALERLVQRKVNGAIRGRGILKEKRLNKAETLKEKVHQEIVNVRKDRTLFRLLAAFLYWGEGSKDLRSVVFTNSDPQMIDAFLSFFRRGFSVDEKKFRCLVHVHEYHDEVSIQKFWSEITHIPIARFQKSYLKKNTGKNTREGYKGTLSIRYYDAQIAQELITLYNTAYLLLPRGVG